MKSTACALVLAAILAIVGCGKVSDNAPAAEPKNPPPGKGTASAKTADALPAAKATAAIAGKVLFEGTPPSPEPIPQEKIEAAKDTLCTDHHSTDPIASEGLIVSKDGAIRNAVVYVKRFPTEQMHTAPSTPVRVVQKGCAYVPHVVGIMAKQSLVVTSDDDTTHNVHVFAKYNRIRKSNFTQVKGAEDTMTFKRPELGTAYLKCDIHSWMKSYLCIFSHPFFVVTGDDGSFALGELPAGQYEIGVWHETLGLQSQEITLTDAETASLDFTLMQE